MHAHAANLHLRATSLTCKQADVGLAGLEGTAGLSHHLLPLLLQRRHLGQRKCSIKNTSGTIKPAGDIKESGEHGARSRTRKTEAAAPAVKRQQDGGERPSGGVGAVIFPPAETGCNAVYVLPSVTMIGS